MGQSQLSLADALNKCVDRMASGSHAIASSSERTTDAWVGLSGAIKSAGSGLSSMLGSMLGIKGGASALERFISKIHGMADPRHRVLSSIREADAANRTTAYTTRIAKLEKDLDDIRASYRSAMASGDTRGADRASADFDEYAQEIESLKILRERAKEEQQLFRVEKERGKLAEIAVNAKNKITALGAGELATLFLAMRQYNRINNGLMLANSELKVRQGLINDVLRAQIETGNETEDMIMATRQLTEYGVDLTKSFSESLALVSRLEEGLGITVDHGAQLVFYFGSRLKESVSAVAGIISTIVDKTALSANKAAEYATNMAKVANTMRLGSMGPGGATALTKYVLDLEAASQVTTGISGEFQSLIQRMTSSVTGLQQAMIIGLNPEDLTGANGLDNLVNGLERMGKTFENLDPKSRIAQLEQMSNMLGISVETLSQIDRIAPEFRKIHAATKDQVDINQRWSNQVSQAGKVFHRLGVAASALAYRGLSPVIHYITRVTEKLVDVLEWMGKSETAITGVTVAMTTLATVAMVKTVHSVGMLTAALLGFSTASASAAASSRISAVSTIFSQLASTRWGPIGNALKDTFKAAGVGMFTLAGLKASLVGVSEAAKKGFAIGGSAISSIISRIGAGFSVAARTLISGVYAAAAVISGPALMLGGAVVALGGTIWALREIVKANAEAEKEKQRGVSQQYRDEIIAAGLRKSTEKLRFEKWDKVGEWITKRSEETAKGLYEYPGAKASQSQLSAYYDKLREVKDAQLKELQDQQTNVEYYSRAFREKVALKGPTDDYDKKLEQIRDASKLVADKIDEVTAQLKEANKQRDEVQRRFDQYREDDSFFKLLKAPPTIDPAWQAPAY